MHSEIFSTFVFTVKQCLFPTRYKLQQKIINYQVQNMITMILLMDSIQFLWSGCNDRHDCKQISGKLLAIKIQKNFSMINFEEFQIDAIHKEHFSISNIEHPCQPFSHDHILTPQQTVHSIHDTNIQEIQDHYSSIQHSANILDQINRLQEVFPEGADSELDGKENSEQCKLRKRLERRMKNETKNIPKNFGKGIISFIQRNDQKVKALLAKNDVNYHDFVQRLKVQKKVINTIADLRRLWTDPVIGKCMRIISNVFFRRHALNYIFNSRISNFSSHVKYRQSLWQALRKPESFNRIKQY